LLDDTLVTAFDDEPRRVLDVGTGSGAIILALARARPNWTLWASDVSPDALAVAQHNAKKYGLAQRIQWVEADMLTPFDKQTFDIIVANPPYIDVKDPHMDALQYEPQSALVSAQAGYVHLQSLIADAKVRLAPQGVLLLEHGYNQQATLLSYAETIGYTIRRGLNDLAGIERAVWLQMD